MYEDLLTSVFFELGCEYPNGIAVEDIAYINKLLDEIVEVEMARYNSLFLTEYVELDKLNETIPSNWNNAYELPEGYISKVVVGVRAFKGLHKRPEEVNGNDYQIVKANSRIYTTDKFGDKLYLLYIKKKPMEEWTTAFKEYIKYKFASKIAFTFTNNQTITNLMESRSQELGAIYTNEDATEQGHDQRNMGRLSTRDVSIYG